MFWKGVLVHQSWMKNSVFYPYEKKTVYQTNQTRSTDDLLESHEMSSIDLSSAADSYRLDSASCARIVGMCDEEVVEYSDTLARRPLQISNAIVEDSKEGPHIESQFATTLEPPGKKHFRGRFLLIPAGESDGEVSPTKQVGRFLVESSVEIPACSPTSTGVAACDHASISDDGYGSLESRKD
jgi:hypothetical protein